MIFFCKAKRLRCVLVITLAQSFIYGIFYESAVKFGMNKVQVIETAALFKNKINFRRYLRLGDTFTVITGRDIAAGAPTRCQRIGTASLTNTSMIFDVFL